MKKRKFKYIESFPEGEHVVSMLNFKNRILIATEKRIYEFKEEKLIPIEMWMETDD
jgi:TFIIF-interacting CTD phosphatase-like protein